MGEAPMASKMTCSGGERGRIGAGSPHVSYWLNTRISLEDTSSYHLFKLIIHTPSGIFVFFVIKRLLAWAGTEESTRTVWAALGAVLLLLHPSHSESVAYISGHFLRRRSPARGVSAQEPSEATQAAYA